MNNHNLLTTKNQGIKVGETTIDSYNNINVQTRHTKTALCSPTVSNTSPHGGTGSDTAGGSPHERGTTRFDILDMGGGNQIRAGAKTGLDTQN